MKWIIAVLMGLLLVSTAIATHTGAKVGIGGTIALPKDNPVEKKLCDPDIPICNPQPQPQSQSGSGGGLYCPEIKLNRVREIKDDCFRHDGVKYFVSRNKLRDHKDVQVLVFKTGNKKQWIGAMGIKLGATKQFKQFNLEWKDKKTILVSMA
jgi:hypothetical protein